MISIVDEKFGGVGIKKRNIFIFFLSRVVIVRDGWVRFDFI